MHFNNAMLLFPILLQASNANSISSISAIPVDNITGLPFEATNSISGISVISKEAPAAARDCLEN